MFSKFESSKLEKSLLEAHLYKYWYDTRNVLREADEHIVSG